ncbi:MAG: carbohydrate kinase family protein [Lachnospiraceae bacterium]|nr:carbohydrate kinase family protein [Lachnospiraceae bacterium]
MDKKVVVAGHVCIDLTPVFSGKKKISSVQELLKPGKLISMEGINIHTGGVVSNTGLAMIFFGNNVSLMGKVGNDELGRMVLHILKEHGLKDERGMIVSDGDSTSYTIALAMPGIDRIFLHSAGANDSFGLGDVDFDIVHDADLFHFGYMPLMKKTYLNDAEEMLRILDRVREGGTITSMDMAAVDADSVAGSVDWRSIIERIIPKVDIFVPSIEELVYMMSPEKYAELEKRASGGDITLSLDIKRDVAPLAKELIGLGAKVIMIKCGAPGMYYKTSDERSLERISERLGIDAKEWGDKEGFVRSFVPDKILSGTGAGDTSIAAFLTSMLKGFGVEKAVNYAAATGASCLTAYDSLSGLLSFEEIEKKIGGGWKKTGEEDK